MSSRIISTENLGNAVTTTVVSEPVMPTIPYAALGIGAVAGYLVLKKNPIVGALIGAVVAYLFVSMTPKTTV